MLAVPVTVTSRPVSPLAMRYSVLVSGLSSDTDRFAPLDSVAELEPASAVPVTTRARITTSGNTLNLGIPIPSFGYLRNALVSAFVPGLGSITSVQTQRARRLSYVA